jgi:site-specific recombinase XerD
MDKGHRVLTVVRKGGKQTKVPLTPAAWAAVEAYLVDRAERVGLADWRNLEGPLLATAAGGQLRQGHLWDLVRRLARAAGIEVWDQLSPHSLRHTGITPRPRRRRQPMTSPPSSAAPATSGSPHTRPVTTAKSNATTGS